MSNESDFIWRSRVSDASPRGNWDDLRNASIFQRRVVYEDNHLLVVDKPIGLATQGAPSGVESLFTCAQRYVKIKYNKPGEVYLGVVSRLDLPVSGIVLFARTSKAAERLNEQIRERTVQKIYRALIEGTISPERGELTDLIAKDRNNGNLRVVRSARGQTATSSSYELQDARLEYRVLERFPRTTLVEIQLHTGRKHQIRLQFSSRGAPIVGDGKYGARPLDRAGICLHSYQLSITHPTLKQLMTFVSETPRYWSGMTQ